MTSYELETRLRSFTERLADNDGELTEELQRECDELQGGLTEKIPALVHVIEEKKSYQKAINEARQRYIDNSLRRERGYEKSVKYLEKRLLGLLEADGRKTYECPDFRVILTTSERLMIMDEREIPLEFSAHKWTPMKSAIKSAIKAGREVPGCRIKTEQHVQIK